MLKKEISYHPNILVVEDSAVIRRSLVKRLVDMGVQVAQAEDGQQGLEIALSEKFDLIISDIEMPRLNGYGLCEKLKNDSRTRDIPVIILSSLDSESDIDRGFEIGAAAYLTKSKALSLLHETIERVLSKATFHRERLVLIVDDSPTIRKLVENGLRESGFRVMIAENGKQAMDIINIQRPDLILSDINMPEMNGVEFCKAVHGNPDWAAIPFITMSTNSDRGVMRHMLNEGAVGYLTKPFNLEQLVITVEKMLSDHFLLLLKDRERLDMERKMMLASMSSLAEALEARDNYTRGHSESVSMVVTGMAACMNMSDDNIETLRFGARFHDLGKIGVPDNILHNPNKLTDDEFAIIRQHPTIGADILGKIPALDKIIPVILYHHERFDGKGYPHGLKGDKIPFWARMTAVADTYHALTSDRPYRNGMTQGKALQIIEDSRGAQLCPECVGTFLSWISCQTKAV